MSNGVRWNALRTHSWPLPHLVRPHKPGPLRGRGQLSDATAMRYLGPRTKEPRLSVSRQSGEKKTEANSFQISCCVTIGGTTLREKHDGHWADRAARRTKETMCCKPPSRDLRCLPTHNRNDLLACCSRFRLLRPTLRGRSRAAGMGPQHTTHCSLEKR